MKTFRSLLLAATCITLSLSSFANQELSLNKLSLDYALKTYIDAISSGKIKDFADILDSEVKFTVTHGERITNYNGSQMINWMKSNENVIQNCITDYAVVEQNATQAIIKVTMKYDAFSRINYVTMAQTNKGWKITNVSSVFV